jgi:hypothetical protein
MYLYSLQIKGDSQKKKIENDASNNSSIVALPKELFIRRPNVFEISNNTFSKWWESVKDGL